MACSPESADVRDVLALYRGVSIENLAKRYERAKRAGELRAGANPTTLSRFYWTVLNGMAISASDGATAAQLRETAALAMAAWPAK